MSINVGSFTTSEVNLKQICEFIIGEDVNNESGDRREKICNFLLHFYRTRVIFTYDEIEDLNNFLKLIISKFKEDENTSFFEEILLTHFENVSNSFVNSKLKDNKFYVDHVRNYFLFLFDLGLYFKKRTGREQFQKLGFAKTHCLLVPLVKHLKQFLVDTLRLVESSYNGELHCKLISEGRILETLTGLHAQNEVADKDITHCFLLLTQHKEFDQDVIKCGIMKCFTSMLLHNETTVKHSYISQMVINIVMRNGKSMNMLINNSELEYVNRVLEILYEKIKRECYDLNCINLLKLLYYVLQSENSSVAYFLRNCEKKKLLHGQEILFFNNVNEIIAHTELVIKSENVCDKGEERNELFRDFLCVLLCVLRCMLDLVFSSSNGPTFESVSNGNSLEKKKNEKELKKEGEMNEAEEEVKKEYINLVNNAVNLSLQFLARNCYPLPGEKKMLHLLCFDVISGTCNSFFTILEEEKKKIINLMISHLVTQKATVAVNEGKSEDKEDCNNYLFAKHFEVLLYISLNNEKLCKECFKNEFILQVEKNYYELDKNGKLTNVKRKEVTNLLKLCYLGIIYIFIKINLEDKEKNFLRPFVQHVILKELKEKSYLLQNELYYLTFLQFLNMSLLNNLYSLKKFLEEDSLSDLLKIFRSSTIPFKYLWMERKEFLGLIKIYVKRNKLLLNVLLGFWKEVHMDNIRGDTHLRDESATLNDVKYVIHHICRILTNDFTKYLHLFSETSSSLRSFTDIMTFEEKCILNVYLKIREEAESNQFDVLETDKNILTNKIKTCTEKVEHMEKRLRIAKDANYKKNANELESYYAYVLNQK
ncbi:conserved Plasmodium protein, unknown function [Plasmodium ovale wallikeri]|uniref:Uncharacterized protein n=1 Tax=Plasmodium ovale wallikeri TaxID=864142 RepID=A0A1A8YW25_PLAOA|nr:conserved Plasmodium protein, unknown function [Plasmodium ovale wallikeri]SBT36243.1 conserved Plasmodium protein, unknown function [Plasmodium ovale wallikeri]